ncbi:HEAT repeat domain-containing protein [Alkalihalobacillus deserti]|uniref:HEAT repeat domain-containing protein n=1 Tax=Alkalihalobacillus deserti TaxID=2879466 RepID=UPI001D149E13|nr:HEAT repeat domain-containing protein [Alkalihalobacillus deserti]
MEDVLKKLNEEENTYKLSMLLEKIAQGEIEDCSPIIKFLNDKRPAVRHSAIEALRACKSPAAENALIKVITESQDEYDLIYANAVLSKIGTNKAVPHLINLLEHHKGDVKCSALWALKEIGDASLLPSFLEALQDRSANVKGYAMLGIDRHGNETAIKPVIERIKTMLKRKRTIESDDLILALGFLIRFEEDNEEIHKLFDWIKSKKWDFLFDMEKEWIIKNIN